MRMPTASALIRIVVIVSLIVANSAFAAANGGFAADLGDCTELIGLGPVPLDAVQPLVPSGYTIVPFGPGVAGLVVRASSCRSTRIGGTNNDSVNVAQIGVAIVSPDATGDINNYVLQLATNDTRLWAAFVAAGMSPGFDPHLTYEFTPATGEVYVAVSPEGSPVYFHTGNAVDPAPGGFPITANWWLQTRRGTVKMSTAIPELNYGSASTVLHTSKASPLGNIIGGNTDDSFPFFNARGRFSSAVMTVTVQ